MAATQDGARGTGADVRPNEERRRHLERIKALEDQDRDKALRIQEMERACGLLAQKLNEATLENKSLMRLFHEKDKEIELQDIQLAVLRQQKRSLENSVQCMDTAREFLVEELAEAVAVVAKQETSAARSAGDLAKEALSVKEKELEEALSALSAVETKKKHLQQRKSFLEAKLAVLEADKHKLSDAAKAKDMSLAMAVSALASKDLEIANIKVQACSFLASHQQVVAHNHFLSGRNLELEKMQSFREGAENERR